MAEIVLDKIAHSYERRPNAPGDYAVRPLDHVWEDGGAYALLGPSGCGKTTLLNIISGLVRPSEGRVLFDGEDVTDKSTERRNIAQVFQFPVLYDTMSVFDNLAFPLRNRGVGADQVRARVGEVAEMLELTPYLGKRAAGLGADAKQKISLGRGLVRSDVAAILFDEPLTVIDPHVKFQLRRKLKEVHRNYKITLVYVTHDQNEALTLADKVVVMYDGQVVQIGTPEDLFERPEHRFVGYFIGSPGMNFLPCRIVDGAAEIAGGRVPLPDGLAREAAALGGKIELGVRPEFVEFATEGPGLRASVERIEDLGLFKIAALRLGDDVVKAKLAEDASVPDGQAMVRFPPDDVHLYADGVRVRP